MTQTVTIGEKTFTVPDTFTKRDSSKNWRTESEIDLGNKHVLKFTTHKTFSGMLNTGAMVVCREPSETPGVNVEVHTVYQDYNVRLGMNKVRVTDKSCIAQHVELVAKNFEAVLADVLKQYEKELAPGAPETRLELG